MYTVEVINLKDADQVVSESKTFKTKAEVDQYVMEPRDVWFYRITIKDNTRLDLIFPGGRE